MNFQDILSQAAVDYGITLTLEQLQAFNLYYKLLMEWNEKVNLTAITAPQEVAVKHVIDSLSCYDPNIFTPSCRVADVGTGAGFPGIPLKIFQPEIELTLIDSLNKRVAFLQAVVDKLSLSGVNVIHARAEDAARQKVHRDAYHVVVSRAVARLSILCEYCLPFVATGGWFVALKGAQYREEVIEAERAIKLLRGEPPRINVVTLPGLEDRRAVLYVKKSGVTPALFPRKAGTPEKKPL